MSSTMNSRDRLKLALDHREPDRVPYDCAGTTVTSFSAVAYKNAMEFKGYPGFYDESKVVDIISQIIIPPEDMLIALKSDTRRIGAKRVFNLKERLKKEGNVWSLQDQYGCVWAMDEGKDFYFNQKFHPLEAYEDITDVVKRFKLPDIAAYKEEILDTWDSQSAEASKDAGFVADRICAGLTEMFFRYRGYEKGLMDMVLYPAESREILEQIAEYKIQYWDLFGDYIKENRLEDSFLVVSECDDLGTQQSLLMSKEMLEQIVFPPLRRYLGFIKNKIPNAKIFFHCDGSIKKIIPDFIEMGIDILNPVQYTAFDMDLFELKKNFGKDIVFWGAGIDTQGTLVKGSREEIRDEVKRNIDILAPGGGYVFTPIHNIQADVPPENFWALWEAWNEYGSYS